MLKNAFLSVENGKIVYIGNDKPEGKITEFTEGYIVPGFIDIHCHAGGKYTTDEDPRAVAEYHLAHGTTSMLLTFYRDIPHEKLLSCLSEVKTMISDGGNVIGAHLEGPVLNANLGTGSGNFQNYPEKDKYVKYIESGVIKQWTSSPEVDGVIEMIKDIAGAGIVPAIGHSKASYSQVLNAYRAGARLVTHIFDATGTTKDERTLPGTEDISFDEACMLMDDMCYEVICDREWIHVKKEKLALLIKTVGIDRIIAITDSFRNDGNEQSDVNISYGADGKPDLSGSKLTMDKVAANLFRAGYTPCEVAKMTSYNASVLLGLFDRGEISVNKRADLLHLDENMEFVSRI